MIKKDYFDDFTRAVQKINGTDDGADGSMASVLEIDEVDDFTKSVLKIGLIDEITL